jgi:hypothetical protein
MHASIVYEMAMKEENNWMAALTDEQWKEVRKTILLGILNTDMKVHFELVKQTQELAEACENGAGGGIAGLGLEREDQQKARDDTKALMTRCLIHAADISNSVLKPELAHPWAYLVVQEFHNQANREKELGLPFAPHMEASPDDLKALASLQLGFGQFIVSPFWTPLAKCLPELQPRVDQLNANTEYWKARKAEGEAAEAQA